MPTKRIDNLPDPPCRDPEHNPPGMMRYEDGVWEHTCPSCGQQQIFTVRTPLC